jgi:hypothetical protein
MEKRIIGLPVHQTSLIMGITSGLIGVVFTLLMLPFMLMVPLEEGGGLPPVAMMLMLPLLYLVLGYLGTALWVAIFNQIARRVGGLPVWIADDTDTGAQL